MPRKAMRQKCLKQARPAPRGAMPAVPAATNRPPRLHEPYADVRDRLTEADQDDRLTPLARAFVVECVTAGRTNSQINPLLRDAGFLRDGEPDLSPGTLSDLRGRPECQLAVDLLTDEARQVGHNHVSEIIVCWSKIFDAAYGRLMGHGEFADGFGRVSLAETVSTLTAATKVLFGTFAPGLAARLSADAEAAMREMQGADAPSEAPGIADFEARLQKTAAFALERALRRLDQEDGSRNQEDGSRA